MTDDYDPFKDYEPLREIHHRINQTLAKSGGPVVMPPDWAEIDATATVMANNLFARFSKLDNNPDAQELARETITSYRLSVDLPTVAGETLTAYHEGPQYDPANQFSMNRLYAILAVDSRALIPLSVTYTWQDVASQYLTRETHCDVAVSYGCEPTNATEVMVIKSGEFVCLYKACTACRDWFHDPHRRAFRTREFYHDSWDRR